MTLAILGTGGHARSIYDIVKKKNYIFLIKKKNILKLEIEILRSSVTINNC